ncbi:glycosyltransferase family 4 protein [Clostridium perfringens]|uniref:glycosyltransferase family 4 protein n=2 Tax=Clostridium perfringens TaxID=1502 RepID=UPI0004213258|nr:glycosyltransferase family 4 protein [Clostridium perfringens]MDK0571552.1 glycosyltransferase family 4 protein [Clostridium perfringens]MDM0800785.1 glycosyltransferase family 4 protein [Clostridium perfringens]
MAGYVFLSNSSKPSKEEQVSRKEVKLTNVNKPCLKTALDMGYEVWFGVNRESPENLKCELPIHLYDSHTYRSIFNLKDNIIAYKNLMKVLKENNIEVIHCNTPIGGVIGRFCGKRARVKKIIYTAHGFHFYKGAPLVNRTFFKWAEMFMAHWTDAIIIMNKEDYESAKKFRLKRGGKVYYTPGVGIDSKIYRNTNVNKSELRDTLGLKESDVVCISMGDLIARKNYGIAIKSIAKCKNDSIHYLICGTGPELKKLQKLAKEQGVDDRIHFLGFRTDIKELLKISDIFLFTTLQEGMPRSMMEAMASGLPCIASKIRGNVDLLEDGKGGYLVETDSEYQITNKLDELANNPKLRMEMSKANLERIKNFDVKEVEKVIYNIYSDILK